MQSEPIARVRTTVKATIRNKDGLVTDRIVAPGRPKRSPLEEVGNPRFGKPRSSKRKEGRGSGGSNGSKATDSVSQSDSTERATLSDLPAEKKSGRARGPSKIAERKKNSSEAGKNSATEVEARSKSKPAAVVEEEEDWVLENEMKERRSKDVSNVYIPPHARKAEKPAEPAGCCDDEDREFHEKIEEKEPKQRKRPKDTPELTADVIVTNEKLKPTPISDPDNAPISKDRNKSAQVTMKKNLTVKKAIITTQKKWNERQTCQDATADDFLGTSVQPLPTTPQSSSNVWVPVTPPNGRALVQNDSSANRLEGQNFAVIQQRNTTPRSEGSNGYRSTPQKQLAIAASDGDLKRHLAAAQLLYPDKVEKLFADAEGVPWIDSHCHLDFIWEKKRDDFETWMKKYHYFFPPTFAGCIPNFIYPELFTQIGTMANKFDRGWIEKQVKSSFVYGATYGCHPHKADLYSDEVHNELFGFCRDKKKFKTIAIGECGLDYHRNISSKENQREAFRRQLKLAHDHNLTIVIHCRPAQADDETEDECLDILQKNVGHYHNIHRHCFTGNKRTAEKWVEKFPNTYFGFTCSIENANEGQKEAIRALSIDRILIETDAPFFKPKQFYQEDTDRTAFPGMAIAAAELVAKYKALPLPEVLRATRRNVDRCYGMPVL